MTSTVQGTMEQTLLPRNRAEPILPEAQEWWTPGDIAEYLHVTPNAVTYHCRRLFPHHESGHRSRLAYAEALRVYNYVRKFGCKRERPLAGV